MKITYEGFVLIPRYNLKADVCPFEHLYSTEEEAERHRTSYTVETLLMAAKIEITPLGLTNSH